MQGRFEVYLPLTGSAHDFEVEAEVAIAAAVPLWKQTDMFYKRF